MFGSNPKITPVSRGVLYKLSYQGNNSAGRGLNTIATPQGKANLENLCYSTVY